MGPLIFVLLNIQFSLRPYLCKVFSCPVKQQESVISKPLNAERLMTIVNDWRISQNLQAYKKNEVLCKISDERANDGLDNHKGFLERFSKYPSFISENSLAIPFSEENALDRWLKSPQHRENLEKSYVYSCISCAPNTVCVQIFSSCERGCL